MRRSSFWSRIALFFLVLVLAPLARAEVIQLDNEGLKRLMAEGATVVDIRRSEEWQQTGIIEGSRLVTLPLNKAGDAYDVVAWMDVFGKLVRPDQPVIILCRSGNRSTSVSSFLDRHAGYTKVYNVTKGINQWLKEGYPVVPYQAPQAVPRDGAGGGK